MVPGRGVPGGGIEGPVWPPLAGRGSGALGGLSKLACPTEVLGISAMRGPRLWVREPCPHFSGWTQLSWCVPRPLLKSPKVTACSVGRLQLAPARDEGLGEAAGLWGSRLPGAVCPSPVLTALEPSQGAGGRRSVAQRAVMARPPAVESI